MSYPLLHELLDLVERYEEFRGNAEQSMSNFLRFADQSLEQQASTEESMTGSKGDAYLNAVIARDISFVYRYMRYLVRKAIKDTPLQTIDEYSYLITLMAKGEMTKTELNNYNVVEKTSGSEIIRRLLKSGLISQTRNLEDRRSLLLSITPEGRKVVKELLPRMQQSSDLLLRDLSWDQKIFLHTLHEQLYESNHPLFLTERDTDLEELLKKVPIKQASRPNK
ncbi:MarR family winged helix-turn-helix transcriptional regulator [Porphyromonas uenonis]|uniref:MarR family winged helix-turn-helix transcriptional regulator n=1 Tax=Porphyromonas uenonis TaxID=281920 RepID=UPI0026EC34E4|nr:MarR family transcriptional regulator [Porphyromonas uenonis]